MRSLVVVFLITGALAAILMLVTVTIFPPAQGANIQMQAAGEIQAFSTPDQIVKAFTTDDFVNLLSRRAMLPLILFTIFFGFCLQSLGERGRSIGRGISVVADAMLQMVKYLMYYAPIGLGAYFATLVGDYGPQLLGAYFRSMVVYHVATFGYFFVAFTIYSWWATDGRGVRVFWSKIIAPALMALGSGELTGQGLFHGAQTQSSNVWSIPERQTDFIFSVCGEELGFLGCALIIVLLLAIVVRCLLVARDAATPMESYVCVGMAGMLIFQPIANIGMCLFLMPVIGLTLPFFSYGGSSIVTLFAAMGIVSGVKKRSRPEWLTN